MSRYKPLIERSNTDRIELLKIVQNPLSDPDLIIRARAILLFFDGSKGDAIAQTLQVRPNTVSDWRKRYETNGIEGLYDKAPKGRRGSEIRNKVLNMLEEQAPDRGWSTKTLAEAVGTSQDTVRRALKDQHITVSNATIWDTEISESPAGICANAIGLYLSKKEAGFIVQFDSILASQTVTRSCVTTSNIGLARSLMQMEQSANGLSLDEAIQLSVQQMKEVTRGEKENFQDFFSRIIKENRTTRDQSDTADKPQYYVFYWNEDQKKCKPVLQNTGMVVNMTEDMFQWVQMIAPWINMMTSVSSTIGSSVKADTLIKAISLYLNKTTIYVEPFEWRRFPA